MYSSVFLFQIQIVTLFLLLLTFFHFLDTFLGWTWARQSYGYKSSYNSGLGKSNLGQRSH